MRIAYIVAIALLVGCANETPPNSTSTNATPLVSPEMLEAEKQRQAQEREQTAELTRKMLKVDIPGQFKPHSNMSLGLGHMASYLGDDGATLMFWRMNDVDAAKRVAEQVPEQIDDEDIKEVSHTTKTYTINGQPSEFHFREMSGVYTNAKFVVFGGAFQNRSGAWLAISAQMPVSGYDESEIDSMIRSIE